MVTQSRPEQPVNLDGLATLVRWRLVALAARSALRVTPLFLPAKSASPRAARLQLGAVDVCVMFPALSATRGAAISEPRLARKADDVMTAAAEDFQGFEGEFHAAKAAGLAATVALDKPQDKLVSQVLETIKACIRAVQAHEEVPRAQDAKVPDPWREIQKDYDRILSMPLGRNGEVPERFLLGPLWEGGSLWWDRVVDRWEKELEGHRLSDLITARRRMDGGSVSWALAAKRMEEWGAEAIKGYQPKIQFESSRGPEEPSGRNEQGPRQEAKRSGAEAAEEASGPPEREVIPRPAIGTVTAEMNLRSGLGTRHSVVAQLMTGDKVAVLAKEKNWLMVSHQGRTGFVQREFVSIPDAEAPAPLKAEAATAAKAKPGEKKVEEADAAPAGRVKSRMLDDEALKDGRGDRLDFKAYANALWALIDDPETKTPLTLAINAPWGAGKTTLARMVQARLESNLATDGTRPHVTCWFNAWKHDDAPSLAGAFAAEIAREANKRRHTLRRVFDPLPWSLLEPQAQRTRKVWLGLVLIVLAVAGTTLVFPHWKHWEEQKESTASVTTGTATTQDASQKVLSKTTSEGTSSTRVLPKAQTTTDPLDKWVGNALALSSFFTAILGLLAVVAKAVPVILSMRPLASYVANPTETATRGAMDQVAEQLGRLIREGTPRASRFIIFVDDVERCQAPRSVEVLEVANQLLNHEGVVTVLMADMPAVAACAQIKYEKLAAVYTPTGTSEAEGGKQAYGRAYLQKIIQIQFDLPPHAPEKIHHFVLELLREKEDENKEPAQSTIERKLGRTMKLLRWVEDWGRASRTNLTLLPQPSMKWTQGLRLGRDFREQVLAGSRWGVPARLLRWALMVAPRLVVSKADESVYPRNEAFRAFYPGMGWFWFSVAMGAVYVMGLSLSLIALLVGPGAEVLWWHRFSLPVGIFAATILFVGLLGWLRSWYQRRKDISVWQKQSTVIRQKGKEALNAEALREEVAQATGLDAEEVDAEVVQTQWEQARANESVIRDQAEGEAMKFLARLPRSAKRTINRLRLFLIMADERNMFDGNAGVTPRHIGKWAVLCERWPELAQELAQEPSKMGELEREASEGTAFGFSRLVRNLAAAYAEDGELLRFCKAERSGVKLAGVMEKLVHFEPGKAEAPRAAGPPGLAAS